MGSFVAYCQLCRSSGEMTARQGGETSRWKQMAKMTATEGPNRHVRRAPSGLIHISSSTREKESGAHFVLCNTKRFRNVRAVLNPFQKHFINRRDSSKVPGILNNERMSTTRELGKCRDSVLFFFAAICLPHRRWCVDKI